MPHGKVIWRKAANSDSIEEDHQQTPSVTVTFLAHAAALSDEERVARPQATFHNERKIARKTHIISEPAPQLEVRIRALRDLIRPSSVPGLADLVQFCSLSAARHSHTAHLR